MSEKIIVNKSTLSPVADALRSATGSTETYSVAELADAAIERILNGGGPTGGNATADDIVEGKTAYVNGKELVGTNPYNKAATDAEISEQEAILVEITNTLQTKAAGASPRLQNKTVTPSTSRQDVVSDDGYDGLKQVTVYAMPSGSIGAPAITVNGSGLISATTTVSAGYVSDGNKSNTKQLTTQAEKTITPGTSNQTAVAKGVYTTGTITVQGDSALIADNIKSGVSIFGVRGTYSGGGGGSSVETCNIHVFRSTFMLGGPQYEIIAVDYSNGEASLVRQEISSQEEAHLVMQKKSFLIISSDINFDESTTPVITGSASILCNSFLYGNINTIAVLITGDCEIDIS